MNRRSFLKLMGITTSSMLLHNCSAGSLPLIQSDIDLLNKDYSFLGLTKSLYQDYSYETEIEGILPDDLQGTLYRNGPGLFDRNNMRKRALLDGDGMVQAFRFHEKGVSYLSRFVRTKKFIKEEKAESFIFPTLSTQAPGGLFSNMFAAGDIQVQAGITVIKWQGKLYAFDEHKSPYTLDPHTIETIGQDKLGLDSRDAFFSAHWKIDGKTGEWLHFGFEYGPSPKIHFMIYDRSGKLKSHRKTRLPRFVYVHDYFISKNYQIINLQPLYISFFGFLLGLRSMSDSLRWRPERGSLLFLAPRDGSENYIMIETDSVFSWHTINAYESGDEIIADFIGYSFPDHFIGKNPVILEVMKGKKGNYRFPGLIRRFIIHPGKKRAYQKIIHNGNYEWPFINLKKRCYPYQTLYTASPKEGDFFWSKVCKIDIKSGKEDIWTFPDDVYSSEPVFVPKKSKKDDEGYILTQGYDGIKKKSFLAVFDAQRINNGPLAIVRLKTHVPFSFHGWWQDIK